MDNAGWAAHRRAKRESEQYAHPQRGADGRFHAIEEVMPMHESFIGGFSPQPSFRAPSPAPPALPPKDGIYSQSYFTKVPSTSTISSSQLSQMTAVERSRILRIARMTPHLQFMVGPLLKYDTVDEHGVWHGAAMVVTADSGSSYEPHPLLTYKWDPDKPSRSKVLQKHSAGRSFDLGPHPADPHATVLPTAVPNGANDQVYGPNASTQQVTGQEIYVYAGNGGTFTFWRFMIHIPLGPHEMAITYSINHGQELEFHVPGRHQNMRWASYSCNGFSAGVNPDDFRGPGFQSGYDPCWADLMAKHNEEPFHVLVGGGDQLYCDGLTREPELQEWVSQVKGEEKKNYAMTEEIASAIDRFYFNHYCQSFRSGAFARANCSIPMMNMADDHDLIDGFGSYPEDLQMSPMFKTIGEKGYFFFLLFQCFINTEIDGVTDEPGKHTFQSVIIGNKGPYIPFPSHSALGYLGPQTYILLLDGRAERKKDQVCSPFEYQKVFQRLRALPSTVEQVVMQLGIPIAYPRMVFLETALESKFNPLVALGRSGSMGLKTFVNKFNADAELLDDLNDHWTSRSHKQERNWFIQQLQAFAKEKRIRVSFLSGDVHCAAVGLFKTLKVKGGGEVTPPMDHRYMINIVTSAIVNTPPPNAVITMVSSLASKVHKTMHAQQTDETMIPLFETDPDGSSRKQKYIMGRRNYCITTWDESTGDLVFTVCVEKEKGVGQTVEYTVRSPPPRWSSS